MHAAATSGAAHSGAASARNPDFLGSIDAQQNGRNYVAFRNEVWVSVAHSCGTAVGVFIRSTDVNERSIVEHERINNNDSDDCGDDYIDGDDGDSDADDESVNYAPQTPNHRLPLHDNYERLLR